MGTLHLWRFLALALVAMCACAGCSTTQANADPFEKPNRFFYKVDDGLDKIALKPLSDAYVYIVPKPIRTGLGNGFDNLGYFNVILNDFLQAKWDQGWSDSGRMAVNSTIGIAGIFDVASPMGMPSHDNDFGITLGKWGVPTGPYLVLPLFGPSTVCDSSGIAVQIMANPLTWYDSGLWVTIPLNVTEAIDARSRAEQEVRFRDQAAIDPYSFTRNAYLQYRENLVHEGKSNAEPGMYDEDTGPDTQPASESQPATQPAK